jgi:5,6,7,8-tetrahydromethanopterin hydro-lyase
VAVINKTRVGEALCGVGHELAHVDLLIGPRGSSAEMAFANCLTNNKQGFTSLLSVVAPNLPARPHTVMFNKVTIRNGRQAVQMFGPAQRGVAMAIADSVHEGVIPIAEADHVFIAVGVFVHWLAEDDARIQDFNYEATKLALRRAVKGDPKILDVLRQKDLQEHPLADHK